jgi:hypothetical protein
MGSSPFEVDEGMPVQPRAEPGYAGLGDKEEDWRQPETGPPQGLPAKPRPEPKDDAPEHDPLI